MTQYQECSVDGPEDFEVHTTRRPHWRRIGLGLVVVGAIGVSVYTQTPEPPATPIVRLARLHHRIVSLAADTDDDLGLPLASQVSFSLRDEKIEDDPDAMTIDVKMRKGNYDGPEEIKCAVSSQEGKAQEFTEALQDLKNTILDHVEEQMGSNHRDSLDAAIEIAGEVDEENTVEIKLTLPAKPGPPEESNLPKPGPSQEAPARKLPSVDEEENEKPELTARLSFGRDLEHMWENRDDSCATVHNGLKFTASTKLAKRVLVLWGEDFGMRLDEQTQQRLRTLEAISSISTDSEVQYRKDALSALAPPVREMADMIVGQARAVPIVIREKIVALKEFANGVHKVMLRGGPGQNEMIWELTNFRITALLAGILDAEESDDDVWQVAPATYPEAK